MRIYICDDEIQMVKQIMDKVRKLMPDSHVEEFISAEMLMEGLLRECPDLLLLDIDMPGKSGMDVAGELKRMQVSPLLVFVTGHDELVYDSLQFHPFGFVRKAFLEAELPRVLEDCERQLSEKRAMYRLRCSEGEVYLPLSEILYFEAAANYLTVYTRRESYRFRETLSAVGEALCDKGFVRVHKGFLVNMAAVKLLGQGALMLDTGQEIPVGRSYSEDVKKQIMRYMLR